MKIEYLSVLKLRFSTLTPDGDNGGPEEIRVRNVYHKYNNYVESRH